LTEEYIKILAFQTFMWYNGNERKLFTISEPKVPKPFNVFKINFAKGPYNGSREECW